jgi:HEAT repeat protein/CheY-like chemotaxis protein
MLVVAQEDEPVAKTPKAKKAAEPEAPVEKVVDDPIIVQLRESAPATLDQLTRALRITSQLDRADEFKVYAADWLKLTPSDPDLAALNRKYGADFFFELTRRADLQPEGEQIATAVLTGASKYARDPARLNEMINKLSDSATQTAALRGLREAGEAGVVALIHALADDTFKADRRAMRTALVALGRDTIEPLTAALAAPLPETRADAAIVLGRLKSRRAMPYLVGLAAVDSDSADRAAAQEVLQRLGLPTPSQRQASKFLTTRIHSLLAGEIVGKLDANDAIPLWRWDDKAQTVRLDRYPKEQAALVIADRLAEQLSQLNPEPSQQQLALVVQLEADQTFAGLDQPLPQGKGTAWETAHALSIEASEGALVDAIELDRPTAIAAILEVLGTSGRSELLDPENGRESPLVKALGYPDRRVQVAALKAILALDPAEPYKGASRVVETMKYLLSSSGQPRVLVGHPRFDESSRIGALYGELGYESDSAATGRAVVRQAADNADYELLLISETIDGPNVQETVQILRKDPRTARIPIGILEHFVVLDPKFIPDPLRFTKEHKIAVDPLTAEERADRLLADERHAPQRLPGGKAEKAAATVKLAVVVPSPQSPEGLNYVHDQVMRLAPSRHVAPEIRLEQAYYVLEQLAELLNREQPPDFYDFMQLEPAVIAASRVPSLSAQAATVLGLLGTPKAQLTLVEQAGLPGNAEEDRGAAVKAFAQAVQKRGIALTAAQIQQLYDRHEQSAPEQQSQLRELLDVIEAPTAKAREEKRKLLQK